MRIVCPHCNSALNSPNDLTGRQVQCPNPGCRQWFVVSAAAPDLPPVPVGVGQAQARIPATSPLPPGMPPLPNGGRQATGYDGVDTASDDATRQYGRRRNRDGDLADMFLGKEKMHVFRFLPGETPLDELTLQLSYFGIIRRGLIKITLTNQRVLFNRTRTFSPLYWLLLLIPGVNLFLLFYYARRISFNRNISMPLGSVDSVEKRYFPNGFILLLAVILGVLAYLVLNVLGVVSVASLGGAGAGMVFLISVAVFAVLGPLTLLALLATRTIAIQVRSDNNHFNVEMYPGVEEKLDAFVQKLNAEVERVKATDG